MAISSTGKVRYGKTYDIKDTLNPDGLSTVLECARINVGGLITYAVCFIRILLVISGKLGGKSVKFAK